jgi:hypothetical protein
MVDSITPSQADQINLQSGKSGCQLCLIESGLHVKQN